MWYDNVTQPSTASTGSEGFREGWHFAIHDLDQMLKEDSSILPRGSFMGLEIYAFGRTSLQKRIQIQNTITNTKSDPGSWKGPQWVKAPKAQASITAHKSTPSLHQSAWNVEGVEILGTDGKVKFKAGDGWLSLISRGWAVVRKPGIAEDEFENEHQEVF